VCHNKYVESHEQNKNMLRKSVNEFDLTDDIRFLKRAVRLIHNILLDQGFTKEEIKVLMGNLYY